MRDVATGEAVRCKRPTWMLFPLEFGLDFQERRFLLAGQPGGGRIVYRPESDRFELHASFTYAVQEIDTGQHFLGVDLGIYTLAAWAVVTADGAIIAEGTISGLELRFVQRRLEQQIRREQQRRGHVSIRTRRAQADEAVHRAANAIVAAAKQHRARVVLEELTPLRRRTKALPHGNRGGQAGRARRRILGRQQYAKLAQVLGYKLALAGLPRPVTVGAAYTSETCPECGHVAAENRPKLREPGQDRISMDAFRCVRCGHAADADCNAARVIGVKGAWLIQVSTHAERGGRTLREEERFAQYLLDAARRRGSSAGRPAVPS
ncbi:MAG: transposase [Rhodospirillales bacterium]|nr:transposase [Acetobacter sp.]